MSDEHDQIYGSLRASTAEMLGYGDIDHLTAAQEIRLSRAISLRLIVDTAQAAQLCGRPYDVRTFTDASEALEKMCGGNPDAPEARRFSGEAQAKLRRLIERTVLTPSFTEHEDIAARQLKDEQMALAAASPHNDAASGRAQRGDGPSESSPAAPAAPPPQRVETAVEKMARVNSTLANPPQGPREVWRDYIDESGSIVAPWFRPG